MFLQCQPSLGRWQIWTSCATQVIFLRNKPPWASWCPTCSKDGKGQVCNGLFDGSTLLFALEDGQGSPAAVALQQLAVLVLENGQDWQEAGRVSNSDQPLQQLKDGTGKGSRESWVRDCYALPQLSLALHPAQDHKPPWFISSFISWPWCECSLEKTGILIFPHHHCSGGNNSGQITGAACFVLGSICFILAVEWFYKYRMIAQKKRMFLWNTTISVIFLTAKSKPVN